MRYVSCVLAMLFLGAPGVHAQTVYRTVDEGVVSFSDTPPEAGEAEVLQVNVPPPADDGLLEERLAQMRETTDRMADDRREREKHRAELRALNTPEPDPLIVQQPVNTWATGYWSGYSRPGYRPRPPYRPGRPSPSPSPLPATAPPGWSVMQPGNSQLMRPILSSRP